MNLLKILLFPLALLYGVGIAFRNFLYETSIFKPKEFNIHTISIGNLSVGGTGKTPHIEYLIRLLQENFKVATLSRGYGRKTNGYLLATSDNTAAEIGDEPRQYKQKFPNITVAVDGNRARGIQALMNTSSDLQLVLLDDAFQHRAIKPELSIVLTDYSLMFYNDTLLPAGRLREFKSAIKRADIIIVTKTPENISPYEKRNIEEKINATSYQKVYFSFIRYHDLLPIHSNISSELRNITIDHIKQQKLGVMLFTGIANPLPLEEYLRKTTPHFSSVRFGDHHLYNGADIGKIKKQYDALPTDKKIIITTEKDYARLNNENLNSELAQLPVFYLPIEIDFNPKDKEEFNQQIIKYASRNKIYVGVYKEQNK